jgi:hypothetical protein
MSDELTPDAPGMESAPAPEAPAVDPRAAQLWDGLNDLDRRPDVLEQVLRPGQDLPPGMTWQQARAALWAQQAQPEVESDPFEEVYGPEPQLIGYDQQGQPVFDQQQYQQPQFDPRSLQPVFDQFGQQITQNAVEQAKAELRQEWAAQAQQQALDTGVREAASKHSLTDFDKTVVENLTRQAQQQGDRRSPSDIADAMAQQYIAAANQRFVAQGGVAPVQGSAAPGGMIPGDQMPKTEAEAIAYSRNALGRPQ